MPAPNPRHVHVSLQLLCKAEPSADRNIQNASSNSRALAFRLCSQSANKEFKDSMPHIKDQSKQVNGTNLTEKMYSKQNTCICQAKQQTNLPKSKQKVRAFQFPCDFESTNKEVRDSQLHAEPQGIQRASSFSLASMHAYASRNIRILAEESDNSDRNSEWFLNEQNRRDQALPASDGAWGHATHSKTFWWSRCADASAPWIQQE